MARIRARGKCRAWWLTGLACLLGVVPARAQQGPFLPYAQPAPAFPQGGQPVPFNQPAPFGQPPGMPSATGQQPFAPQIQSLPVQERTVIVGIQQTVPTPTQLPPPPSQTMILQPPQGMPMPPPGMPGQPPAPGGPPAPVMHNLTNPPPYPGAFAPVDFAGQKWGEGPRPCGEPCMNLPFVIDFRDGVLFKSSDDFFSLRINNLLQVDFRDFSHTAQGVHSATSLQDNFTLAREWLYFRGNVSEFAEYATVFAAGSGGTLSGPAGVNVLDAYLDFNPFGKDAKEFLQVRVGRFKTPFLYQFYKQSPQDFVTPELSMYSTNFQQNRQIGLMAHGLLFDQRLDYAAGVFNGAPNTFEVNQSNKEAIFFVAYQPFVHEKNSIFQNLILSGSYACGEQNTPDDPAALGTAVPSNGPALNLLISPTFLAFSPATTTQSGFHQFWAAEVIWAIRSFNLYAEYTGGQQNYSLTTAPGKTVPVSLSGYSVATSYFFTGEEITPERRRVQPLRPYNWSAGAPGAVEGFFRFSNLVLGSNVFSDGLANPAAFANRVNATDVGANWYLNEYVKLVFDWQHDMFNQPVSFTGVAGGNARRNEDIFWFRFQLYY